MLIQQLELENIKSYRSATFEFREGIHFISGENGSGKTTLIEAIGFVLFNVTPPRYPHFVREGASQGTVRLRFRGEDDREYRVERQCRPQGHLRWVVWDVEEERFLDLHGVPDVVAFLRQALNVRSEHRLSEVYREFVAIPQGTFTFPFLQSPSKRKEIFHAVFRVDDYRKAFDQTSGLDGLYRTRIEGWKGTLSNLYRDTAAYEERLRERSQLEEVHFRCRGELEATRIQLAQVDEHLAEWNQKRDALEAARRALLEARHRWELEIQHRETARSRLKESEEGRRVCEANRTAFETHCQALEEEKLLQAREAERRRLADHLALQERERESVRMRLENLEERLNEYVANRNELEERLPRESEALNVFLAEAEETLRATRTKRRHIEEGFSRIAFLEDRAREMERRSDLLEQEEIALAALIKERERYLEVLRPLEAVRSLAARAPADREARDDALARVNEIRALRKQAEKNRRDAKGGNCPILHEPCQNVGGDLERHFVRLLDLYDEELEAPTQALRNAEEALRESEAAERQLQELEKTAVLLENVERRIAERKTNPCKTGSVVRWGEWESSLKGAVELLTPLDDETLLRRESQELLALRGALSEEQEIALLRRCVPEAVRYLRAIYERWKDRLSGERDRLLEAERDAMTHKAHLEARQEALDQERQRLHGLVQQIERCQEERAHLRAVLAQRERELASTRKELSAYDDVELAFRTLREVLERSREGYTRYREFHRVAELYRERQEVLEAAERHCAAAAEALKIAQQTLRERESSYDDAEHARIQQEHDRLQGAVEGLTERIKSIEENLSRLDKEIASLEGRRLEIEGLEAKIARTEKVRALADFVRRRVLNLAGTSIAAAYRECVSEYATTLYRRFSRENVELKWTEDYDILLRGSESERFFEQLSGGEQMSAALAVRLALLRLLSGVSLAIFDEPTTNLDAERRQRLAQSLPELRGVCRQLFVVSHDDAFDSVVDEIIRIEKVPGVGSRRVDP